MIRLLIGLMLVSWPLYATEQYAIIANARFPLNALTHEQVKRIYLKKLRYISAQELYALNYPARHPLRQQFEHDILGMTPSQLKRYWTKAHYRGVRPPLIQHSFEAVITFVRNVDGALGYLPLDAIPKDVKILYKVEL